MLFFYFTYARTFCMDNDVSCAQWARDGLCANDEHMLRLCPMSCRVCEHDQVDQKYCSDWARNGECNTNKIFMMQNCPAVCGFMYTHCSDFNEKSCDAISSESCDDHVILAMCPKKCGICKSSCVDLSSSCPSWIRDGFSEINARTILPQCSLSAGICASKANDEESSSEIQAQTRPCQDFNETLCKMWGNFACNHNAASVIRLCPLTCGACVDLCYDSRPSNCRAWALEKGGLSDHLTRACPALSGVCQKLQTFQKDEL